MAGQRAAEAGGKWGIILGRLCKSQKPETVQQFFGQTLWPPRVVRVTGSKINRQRLPSLPLEPSVLPVKMM